MFDTETRTDPTQRLTFGSYRFIREGRHVEETLFCADDLSERERTIIEAYARKQNLRLLSRAEFVEELFSLGYKGRCLIVGFNLPFDLSRIACESTAARGRFAGGFSLGFATYRDEQGNIRSDHFRPRIGIKHIDSKRSLIGFTSRRAPDSEDLIPEGSRTGQPEPGYIFRGHFLDLRTLTFALTDRGYSLETACKAFGVEHGKYKAKEHGVITDEYIDYNRRDVLATSELAVKVLAEYSRHPISLQPTKAYSPASIGKAYLRKMGITPLVQRAEGVPTRYLGYACSAFFGGRTSAHIRKVGVPVVYTDFLSMYPTVNALMNLWRFQVAAQIQVVDQPAADFHAFLEHITPDTVFDPALWRKLTAFVRVVPDGDVLPSRAQYSDVSNDWQVAVNRLCARDPRGSVEGLWYSLPDVVASVLLTGRVPRIVDGFSLECSGTLDNLRSVNLAGMVNIDPAKQDFFKNVIQERKRLKTRSDISEEERQRGDKALKVLANSSSYGIYAEMNRQETDQPVEVVCHGIDAEPFRCKVVQPDVPGEFCFPPIAALITGAARLMLALLECCVTDLGGTYAMEDTDSMAIVATRRGGLVACPGAPHKMRDGRSAVRALSWRQVKDISERFARLNPYAPSIVPGSVLKLEDDNFDPATGKQRSIYCYAISAKRYALYVLDKKGEPQVLRAGVNNDKNHWSGHGLGHLLNPADPGGTDQQWMPQVWLSLIRKSMGLPSACLQFADVPAVGKIAVSSPSLARRLEHENREKDYAVQIKPFNFLLSCHVQSLGHPTGIDPEHFHLLAPFETDPRRWTQMLWTDQYSGKQFRITTEGLHGGRSSARVKTYDDVVSEYAYHPESKCADASGAPCSKQTVGLLQRRCIRIGRVRYIGKESNSLEAVNAGLVHSFSTIYTEYADPRRDEWETAIRPLLKNIPLSELVPLTGMSRRALINWRTGHSRPHQTNQQRIKAIVARSEANT